MILSCNESATRTHHTALGPIQTLRLRHQFIGLALFGIYKSAAYPLPHPSLRRLVNPYLISNTSQCVIPDGKPTLSRTIVSRANFTPRSVKNIYLYCGHTVDLVSRDLLKFGLVI
jgi:hypothetical protein